MTNHTSMSDEKKQEQEPEEKSEESKEKSEDTESLKASLAKYKAMADRRKEQIEEFKKIISEDEKPSKDDKKSDDTKTSDKKLTETQEGLTREEAIFFGKGFEEEDLAVAQIIAANKKVSLSEAVKDGYFKSHIEGKQSAEADDKAALPPSSGTGTTPKKDVTEMSEEEHKAAYSEAVAKGLAGG